MACRKTQNFAQLGSLSVTIASFAFPSWRLQGMSNTKTPKKVSKIRRISDTVDWGGVGHFRGSFKDQLRKIVSDCYEICTRDIIAANNCTLYRYYYFSVKAIAVLIRFLAKLVSFSHSLWHTSHIATDICRRGIASLKTIHMQLLWARSENLLRELACRDLDEKPMPKCCAVGGDATERHFDTFWSTWPKRVIISEIAAKYT